MTVRPWSGMVRDLAARPGVAAALLITRDGACVLQESATPVPAEAVSALCAAIHAAGQTVVEDVGGDADLTFRLEASGTGVVGTGLSPELLLVLVFRGPEGPVEAERELREAVRRRPGFPAKGGGPGA